MASFVTAAVPADFQRLVCLFIHDEPDVQQLGIIIHFFSDVEGKEC
jgi:hypothetical protein